MKVLMLGWEYPPHISGGLGTACEGLTLGLARQNVEVLFVIPHLFGGENATHMRLVNALGQSLGVIETLAEKVLRETIARSQREELIQKRYVQSFLQPYLNPQSYSEHLETLQALTHPAYYAQLVEQEVQRYVEVETSITGGNAQQYGWDIFGEVARYSENVSAALSKDNYDIIHCHDWMTYPAGIALKRATGKKLVAHVHSLEVDRSGQSVNGRIFDIESWGLHEADRVIAVSYYTRDLIHKHYHVPLEKIHVVHNGVYSDNVIASYRQAKPAQQKIVLFLGRITFQKGPDYFVEAAAKIVPHVPDVLFVMAGAGDMLPRMVKRVAELGLKKHFQFPGFLKGDEVEEMYSLADVYVMPSVSEPFGIAALEAIKFETPVILSRQSGVSEVLRHALKVDFWDIDRMADLIINALLHEELRLDMVAMAREEIKRLHWESAASRTLEVYKGLNG